VMRILSVLRQWISYLHAEAETTIFSGVGPA
jgi:hypothetical protein